MIKITKAYAIAALVRLLLPTSLLMCIALRPFGISIIYLLLLLIAPLISIPDSKTFSGWRGTYLLLNAVISFLLLLLHIAWHAMLASMQPYGTLLEKYPILSTIGHNLGFVSYSAIAPTKAVHYMLPEVMSTTTSLLVYIVVKRLLVGRAEDTVQKAETKYQSYPLVTSAGKYLCLILIMLSGIIYPSVTSGIYYLMFMGSATAWALGQPLNKGFAVVCRCIMAIMAIHTIVVLVYQCSALNELYPPDKEFARYFGLTKLVEINETDPSLFTYEVEADTKMWATLASPFVILFTYFVLALETRQLFKPKAKKKSALSGLEDGKVNGSLTRGIPFHRGSRVLTRDKWKSATKRVRVSIPYKQNQASRTEARETDPLIRVNSTKRRSLDPTTSSARQLRLDSMGSVVLQDTESAYGVDSEPTLIDDIIMAIVDFFQVLIRSSYIATTITMMAWSIMYHSWLTFVFLMWANVVWLCHDQRGFMLKTSPVLVVYAMLLLIAEYIYGIDLLESELPSNFEHVNLEQIGLGRAETQSCIPLLIKSLFTCMFWVTLRQRVQDIRQRRKSVVIADMVAPLQLTASTAASVLATRDEEMKRSRLMRALGEKLRSLCARYWIYVVVIMLFVIGISGKRMTIFRIIYMFLFLAFILMFQISWYWWRKLIYMFWIVVIVYSMINLILIYIYQFDNFSKIIEEYLMIDASLQQDLGLEPYHPADLFVKLLTPTSFLIITILQVHYFHKDFMALSDPKTRSNSIAPSRQESGKPSQDGASTMRDDLPQLPSEDTNPRSQAGTEPDQSIELSSIHPAPTDAASQRPSLRPRTTSGVSLRQGSAARVSGATGSFDAVLRMFARRSEAYKRTANEVISCLFIYLELHLIKIVFISLMLLCVMNVCAMNVPIMLLITPALWFNFGKQRVCILLLSTLISIYFMAKMVYQFDYIKHANFNVNCSTQDSSTNTTSNISQFNNAEWLGFEKVGPEITLVTMLKGYIGLLALFTFHALVTYRQESLRLSGALPKERTDTIFPNITRQEADIDLVHCLKYLLNYGFYKFGVEVTLICLMGVIGSRMDLYAMMYAAWLLILVSIKRRAKARWWPAFTLSITVVIPLQYMIAVGFLPQLCITYPWAGEDQQMKHIRTWMFLPYAESPPHAHKIIFDFFVLLFATRQINVFNVENTEGSSYPGGSNNENIGKDWETPDFVNPVPDFLGYVGSWLDVLKRMVFLGMLWITLAIMFMTGTNRVNLFSMGYLIGSFIFLWQGTDFYLRPKRAILQWWSWLVRYNVGVVVVKTLLQIPGCILSGMMQEHACWLVQLLGIGCVDKFAGGNIANFIRMNYNKEEICSVPQEDIGLAWDGVCFAFLILQQRLFHSFYFYRVIDESKATTVLASRGAELIEELRIKQMHVQEEQESKILDKIKVKMERIKANQKKIQGVFSREPCHHDRDEEEETMAGESEQVPLVRGDSDASRGYHTPDSPASPRGFHTPLSEPSAPPTPARASLPALPAPGLPGLPASQAGPPSPSSALMTVSLDAYLEPRRISFESPPSSELHPRAQSPEESYPVFSPPPIRRGSASVQRQSVSAWSRAESHHTCNRSSGRVESGSEGPSKGRVYTKRHRVRDRPSYKPPTSHQKAIRSGDYYMFDEFDDTEIQVNDDDSSDDEFAPKHMGISKLLSTMMKTDLKHAVSTHRRASAPNVRTSRRATFSEPVSSPQLRRKQSMHRSLDRFAAPEEGDEPSTELDEFAPLPENETLLEKINGLIETAWAFISSVLASFTRHVLKYSRDYRYVSKTLSIEKKILKEKEGFGIGLREGSQMIWEPLPETLSRHRKLSDISVPEIRILAPSMERGLDDSPPPRRPRLSLSRPPSDDEDDTSEHESAFSLQSSQSHNMTVLEEQDDSMFKQDRSPFVHLGYALWYVVLAHTDVVCYIMVFINQIQSATILSIPLPLMVFMWGTLTIPRPTKTFWVTLIAYTEVIVLIKSMFQFEILPWNQKVIPANMPFTAPRIIGIERKFNYALYDLLLLLIIFLHRFMLKSLGLWKESSPEIELREDMEYPLDQEDTQLVAEGLIEEVGRKYVKLHNESGPCHRLVDRLYHVHTTIMNVMQELQASRSDPRVLNLVWQRLQETRRQARRQARRASLRQRQQSEAQLAVHRHAARGPSNNNADVPSDEDHPSDSALRGEGDASDENDPGPSKRSEDDHYNVNDDEEPIIAVSTTLEKRSSHYPELIMLSIKRYLRPTHRFFERMLAPGARVTADIYAYMFLCDFFNFLVVIFGFAAFGTHQGDGGVKAYLEENKVPIPFLVMLILQFALIVIDRALYLRKFMLGKILFQYALIIGVHIWMFFVLPFITERTFNALLPPPMWYMLKCIYLLLSAYQIRCGYPRRIIGNFLCKSYYFINMVFFRLFMVVPFLFELRTLMDWIWTDTSMALIDWLKMEDIFASVFLLKCSRYIEDEFPQPRGSKKTTTVKYLLGGGVLAFVIAIIWFPLVFFAFGNSVGQPNPPTDVTVKIRIGPFLPIYQMSAQSNNIYVFTEQDYTQLSNLYARDRTAQTFLSNYVYNDVAVITINPNSTLKWEISPPELDRLKREAASNATLRVKFTYVITHPTNAVPNPPTIEDHREVSIPALIAGQPNPQREILRQLLDGTSASETWLNVPEFFPKFLKVFNKGTTKAAYQLIPSSAPGEEYSEKKIEYRDVLLRLERDKVTDVMYWRVRESCSLRDPLLSIPLNNCDMLVMYTFNDKMFPETLNFISGSGIIGLYTTFVFLASRVLRGFFSGIYTRIMFDDLPNADRLLQLCLDIYLVREALELSLEEDLFAKLVFLYRSPETMIKWSRPKEDENMEQPALPPSR